MAVVIDGTTGIDTGTGSLVAASSATATYLDLYEDTDNGSNYVRLIAPTSVASNRTQTLADVTGTLAPIVSDTAVTLTTQTNVDFTGIPSWVKRITVMLSGVSTNGTSVPIIQLGDSGGVETTGYLGSAGSALYTTGVGIASSNAANVIHGIYRFQNITGNTWVADGSIGLSNGGGNSTAAATKALSDTLTQVRITTVNGTDTFDAGTINIIYE